MDWVGLQTAASTGALPAKLSAGEKALRVRCTGTQKLRVIADDIWAARQTLTCRVQKLHGSHDLWYVDPFVFCNKCGAYSSNKVLALGDRCDGKASSSKAAFLRRLRDGRHPRSEEFLGEIIALDFGALQKWVTSVFFTVLPAKTGEESMAPTNWMKNFAHCKRV